MAERKIVINTTSREFDGADVTVRKMYFVNRQSGKSKQTGREWNRISFLKVDPETKRGTNHDFFVDKIPADVDRLVFGDLVEIGFTVDDSGFEVRTILVWVGSVVTPSPFKFA